MGKKKEVLKRLSALLPAGSNGEVAIEADVSPTWASQVRNAVMESAPVQRAIVKVALKKAKELEEAAMELQDAIDQEC